MSKEEVHEKVVYREVIREVEVKGSWDLGSYVGLLILAFLLPLVGIIVGAVNLRHSKRFDQSVGLIVSGLGFWLFWMFVMGVMK